MTGLSFDSLTTLQSLTLAKAMAVHPSGHRAPTSTFHRTCFLLTTTWFNASHQTWSTQDRFRSTIQLTERLINTHLISRSDHPQELLSKLCSSWQSAKIMLPTCGAISDMWLAKETFRSPTNRCPQLQQES